MTPDERLKAIEATARSCQRTWGMGFPVISVKLLEPHIAHWTKAERENEQLRERLTMAEMALRVCHLPLPPYDDILNTEGSKNAED